MVHFCLTFSVRCVEPKLNFVNAVHKPEEGLYSALDSAHELIVSILSKLIVVAGYRNEHAQFTNEVEVTDCDSERDFVVKANVVHEGFQVKTFNFVEDKGLLRVLK
jgi:hypothetical protein